MVNLDIIRLTYKDMFVRPGAREHWCVGCFRGTDFFQPQESMMISREKNFQKGIQIKIFYSRKKNCWNADLKKKDSSSIPFPSPDIMGFPRTRLSASSMQGQRWFHYPYQQTPACLSVCVSCRARHFICIHSICFPIYASLSLELDDTGLGCITAWRPDTEHAAAGAPRRKRAARNEKGGLQRWPGGKILMSI